MQDLHTDYFTLLFQVEGMTIILYGHADLHGFQCIKRLCPIVFVWSSKQQCLQPTQMASLLPLGHLSVVSDHAGMLGILCVKRHRPSLLIRMRARSGIDSNDIVISNDSTMLVLS